MRSISGGRVTRVGIVASALLLMLATMGAVEAELSSDFRDDGGARHGFELTIDKLTLALIGGATGGDGFGALTEMEGPQATAEAAGLDFERIETDELLGARVTREVADASDIDASFAEILRSLLPGAGGIPEGVVSGSFVALDGEYRLEITVDADLLFGGLTGGEGAPAQLGSLVDFAYVATFPGKVIETNGTKVGDDQVRWELPFSGQTTLTALATDEDASGLSLPIVIGGAVVVAVVGAAGGYALLRRRSL